LHSRAPLRFDSASRPHLMTATYFLLRAGTVPVIDYESTGRGFESRPEHSCSGSSDGRAVPGCATTTAAVPFRTTVGLHDHHRGARYGCGP
jgi:hypothetical protein